MSAAAKRTRADADITLISTDEDSSDDSLPYIRVPPAGLVGLPPASQKAPMKRTKKEPPCGDKDLVSLSRMFPELPAVGSVLYSERINPATKAYLIERFKVLYTTWGYRQSADGDHTAYELEMHDLDDAEHNFYHCAYRVTDKLFRNLQQLCTETPSFIPKQDASNSGSTSCDYFPLSNLTNFMCRYLREVGVKAALLELGAFRPWDGPSGLNLGIMAVLSAAARAVLFLSVGQIGTFNPDVISLMPHTANGCLAYINALSENPPRLVQSTRKK